MGAGRQGRLLSVSVDLDGLEHYLAIHGLLGSAGVRNDVYTVALPRFCELFAAVGVQATFFAIGSSLEDPASSQALRAAASAGHEIANHTYGHRYDLVQTDDATLAAEVRRGHDAVEAAAQAPCWGFRAPGYNLDERILTECRALGYRYDSSVFPSYPYYAAKASVMGALRVIGRPSRASLGHPKVLLGPVHPYIPAGDDYRLTAPRLDRGGASADDEPLWELPITLVPGLRFPFIGTWICLWSDWVFDVAFAAVRRSTRFVNLELHGIELLGLAEDRLPAALRRQPDLRVSLAEKRRKLERAIRRIASEFEPVPLRDVPARLAPWR